MNLALCDFFKLTVYEPLRSVEMFLPFSTGEPVTTQFYCQACSFLGYTNFTAGYHTMVAISVERYLVICYPLKSKSWVSVGSTLKIIAIIWIIAVSSMLPVPLKYSNISHIMLADGTRVDFCTSEVFGNDGHVPLSWKVYLICMLIICYVIPVLSMTYCYSVIFQTLNKNLHILRVNDPGLCKVLESRKYFSKRLLMVAVILTLLHTPYFMIVSCISFGGPLPNNPVFSLIWNPADNEFNAATVYILRSITLILSETYVWIIQYITIWGYFKIYTQATTNVKPTNLASCWK